MKHRIYNYYVLSSRFDGEGRGFAVGFDSEKAAYVFANYFLLGFCRVVPDWLVERDYPRWFYGHVS